MLVYIYTMNNMLDQIKCQIKQNKMMKNLFSISHV